jgi:hypothetical protein
VLIDQFSRRKSLLGAESRQYTTMVTERREALSGKVSGHANSLVVVSNVKNKVSRMQRQRQKFYFAPRVGGTAGKDARAGSRAAVR